MEPVYKMNLTQWAVFRCLPPSTNLCVKRFRRRQDAEAYLRILRGMIPDGNFQVVFDQYQELIDQG